MVSRICIIFIWVLISCNKEKKESITIASAASLRPVLKEIVVAFSEKENLSLELITSSSGKLASQIEAGAPYDIFLSANKFFSEHVQTSLKNEDSLFVFAKGRLALLVSKSKFSKLIFPTVLLQNHVSKIAIANPELAPYGKATREMLENLGVKEEVASKLIYGENVGQVNQFLKSKAVDMGITSSSSLKNDTFDKAYYSQILPDSLHQPIENTALITTKRIYKKKQCEKFIAFLKSTQAKRILASYGYDFSK